MQTIQSFRATGQSVAIQFLSSFIKKISSNDKGFTNYANILSENEDSIIFECTSDVYTKIAKKMTNISISIIPIKDMLEDVIL
jgi:hypothetical protein